MVPTRGRPCHPTDVSCHFKSQRYTYCMNILYTVYQSYGFGLRASSQSQSQDEVEAPLRLRLPDSPSANRSTMTDCTRVSRRCGEKAVRGNETPCNFSLPYRVNLCNFSVRSRHRSSAKACVTFPTCRLHGPSLHHRVSSKFQVQYLLERERNDRGTFCARRQSVIHWHTVSRTKRRRHHAVIVRHSLQSGRGLFR